MPDAGSARNTTIRLRGRYTPKEKFKLDPKRPERFRLRLARYVVLSQDISQWAGDAAAHGATLSVLDIGCGWGPLLCQLDGEPNFDNIRFSGADIEDRVLYRRDRYEAFFAGDLTQGYPDIGTGEYDVAVCEQVLEHLDDLDTALKTLERVVRPGGVLVIGVPIFVPPLHLARKHLVPRFGKLIGHSESASHQQAFSLGSFRRLLREYPRLTLIKARGFRIISGGLLRPLENYSWWWQLNRRLGEAFPALCIEVQLILTKRT